MLAYNKLLQRESYWCQWFMGLPCLYQIEPKWKGKPYPRLSEKRDCGGLMEPNLGARRTKKHIWKLQAEPQKVWRACHRTKLFTACTRWTPKWSSKTRFLCHPIGQYVPTLQCRSPEQSQLWHPTHQPTGRHYGHRALWILDHNHWSHEVSRKEYPILPRWHYASWSVHWHSSLYLHCRQKV